MKWLCCKHRNELNLVCNEIYVRGECRGGYAASAEAAIAAEVTRGQPRVTRAKISVQIGSSLSHVIKPLRGGLRPPSVGANISTCGGLIFITSV